MCACVRPSVRMPLRIYYAVSIYVAPCNPDVTSETYNVGPADHDTAANLVWKRRPFAIKGKLPCE